MKLGTFRKGDALCFTLLCSLLCGVTALEAVAARVGFAAAVAAAPRLLCGVAVQEERGGEGHHGALPASQACRRDLAILTTEDIVGCPGVRATPAALRNLTVRAGRRQAGCGAADRRGRRSAGGGVAAVAALLHCPGRKLRPTGTVPALYAASVAIVRTTTAHVFVSHLPPLRLDILVGDSQVYWSCYFSAAPPAPGSFVMIW